MRTRSSSWARTWQKITDTGRSRVIKLGVAITAPLQFLDTHERVLTQFFNFAEADGLRGAGLCTCRHQSRKLAVVTECALARLTLLQLTPATQSMGIAAAAVETLIGIAIEVRGRAVDHPLREGTVGWTIRAGGILAGPVSLLLRVFLGRFFLIRRVAGLSFILGALMSRFAWIAAGRVSARDPQALFRIQQPYQPDVTNRTPETSIIVTERAS